MSISQIEYYSKKSISRFGRDTVEILEALNQLKQFSVRVIFEQEELYTAKTDSELMTSVVEALAQAENELRSDNIKMDINTVRIWNFKAL